MTELAHHQSDAATPIVNWTREQVELVKRMVIKGNRPATDDELTLFEYACRRSDLDPFVGEIWGIIRKEQVGDHYEERLTIQTGIAGFRHQAMRSGRYEGLIGPYWCGQDGTWVDVWLNTIPPAACKVGIHRQGFREPLWAVTLFTEFAQHKANGELTRFWKRMPANQLAKCAKAAAFREAFPRETAGLYVDAEMPEPHLELESGGGAVTSPAPPPATTIPTIQQIRQLATVSDARDLAVNASGQFRTALRAGFDPERWRTFWWDASLAEWKDYLRDALTTLDDQTSAPTQPPGVGADPPSAGPDPEWEAGNGSAEEPTPEGD